MAPDLLKGFFRIGIFILGTSIALLFFVPPDSAEYVVTLLSICVGTALLVLVSLTAWYINR